VFVTVIGVSVYKSYNSIENQSQRMLRNNITEWYYRGLSLTYNSPSEAKKQAEKDEAIKIRRIKDKLADSWILQSEGYKTIKIDYRSSLIDYDYVFENQVTNEKRYYKTRYYYDTGEDMPIPLKDDATSIIDGNYETIKSGRLWSGDFDAYCSSEKQDSMYSDSDDVSL
jgi:hypothetical protein